MSYEKIKLSPDVTGDAGGVAGGDGKDAKQDKELIQQSTVEIVGKNEVSYCRGRS